jgi:two-component system response regulator
MMEPGKVVDILLVEDNADHAALTMRALRDGNMLNEIFWVKDGQEALDFLGHRGRYADRAHAPRPGLILLDIRLPKVDGHEVLRHIKSDPVLKSIPVVMLTTSERDDEIASCYEAGANSYVAKPVKFTDFVRTVKSVKLYWIMVSQLPDPGLARPPAAVDARMSPVR